MNVSAKTIWAPLENYKENDTVEQFEIQETKIKFEIGNWWLSKKFRKSAHGC